MPKKRVPKIRLLEMSDLDPRLQHHASEWRKMGSDPTIFRVFGHIPAEIYLAFLEFYRKLRYRGRIDVGLKEIVRMRIARLNGCDF